MTAKGDFDEIYSPKKFKLRPRDDIYLDLKIKINVQNTLEPWINLLPSLKGLGLKTEDNDWVSNKTKNDTIQLHILNKSFTRTIEIKKIKLLRFYFYQDKRVQTKLILKIPGLHKNYFSISQSRSFLINELSL